MLNLTSFFRGRGSPRGRGGTGARNGPRGPPTRFRGRGFARGSNGPGFRGSPSGNSSHFGTPRGGSRFRGSGNWDNNESPRSGIPSLMSGPIAVCTDG